MSDKETDRKVETDQETKKEADIETGSKTAIQADREG